jgi:putative Holliday junction resolvase
LTKIIVRVLSIDYGRVRVGLAVCQINGGLPRPLQVLHLDAGFWKVLVKLVSEWEVSRIVVGLPVLSGGEEGKMAEEAREFARKVGEETGLVVDLWNEELTTWEAEDALQRRGISARRQRGKKDSIAAAILLERYIGSKNRGRV